MAAGARITVEPFRLLGCSDARIARLYSPCILPSAIACVCTDPRVNVAATVLIQHLRDCGCRATVDLERRYVPHADGLRHLYETERVTPS